VKPRSRGSCEAIEGPAPIASGRGLLNYQGQHPASEEPAINPLATQPEKLPVLADSFQLESHPNTGLAEGDEDTDVDADYI